MMLTGELPFRGRGRMLEAQILEDDPLPPTRLNDAVPAWLQTICLRWLAKIRPTATRLRRRSATIFAATLTANRSARPQAIPPFAESGGTWSH